MPYGCVEADSEQRCVATGEGKGEAGARRLSGLLVGTDVRESCVAGATNREYEQASEQSEICRNS